MPVDAPKDFFRACCRQTVASTGRSYEEVADNMQRLRLWLIHDDGRFVTEEIWGIFGYMKDRPKNSLGTTLEHMALLMGEMINKEKRFLYTFKLVHGLLENDSVALDDNFLRLLFPNPYFDKIQKHNRGLDPYLILSLIRQESAFNPAARSSAGARGLMQLMPATARQLKRRVKTRELKQPDVNLKLGIKYLKRLIGKYDGNLIYALAGYNAGESKVKKWRRRFLQTTTPCLS